MHVQTVDSQATFPLVMWPGYDASSFLLTLGAKNKGYTCTLAGADVSCTLAGADVSCTLVGADVSCTLVGVDVSCTLVGADVSCTLVGADVSCTLVGADVSCTLAGADSLLTHWVMEHKFLEGLYILWKENTTHNDLQEH